MTLVHYFLGLQGPQIFKFNSYYIAALYSLHFRLIVSIVLRFNTKMTNTNTPGPTSKIRSIIWPFTTVFKVITTKAARDITITSLTCLLDLECRLCVRHKLQIYLKVRLLCLINTVWILLIGLPSQFANVPLDQSTHN
jgi:hypothetical protein